MSDRLVYWIKFLYLWKQLNWLRSYRITEVRIESGKISAFAQSTRLYVECLVTNFCLEFFFEF